MAAPTRHLTSKRPNVVVALLRSRKFWLAVAGIVVPVANRKFSLGLDPVEIGSALAVIAAVIIGIAWEDAARKARTDLTFPASTDSNSEHRPHAASPGKFERTDKSARKIRVEEEG